MPKPTIRMRCCVCSSAPATPGTRVCTGCAMILGVTIRKVA